MPVTWGENTPNTTYETVWKRDGNKQKGFIVHKDVSAEIQPLDTEEHSFNMKHQMYV